jgi:Tol biopolymer transport system component
VAFWAHFRPVSVLQGNSQLWVVSADGSQSAIVRDYANSDPYLPQNGITGALNWSPAGQELVYEAYSGSGILVAVDVATGDVNELLDGGSNYDNPVFQPSLSPDLDPAPGYQGMVAMGGLDGSVDADGRNQFDIYVAPVDSDADGYLLPVDPARIDNITNAPGTTEAHASWSPDGSAIACYQDDGTTEWLAVIEMPAGVLVPLHPDYATVGAGQDRAAWTSDGLDLIYRTQFSGIDIFDLTIIAADGSSGPTNYTNTGSRREEGPAWNPQWDPAGPGGF